MLESIIGFVIFLIILILGLLTGTVDNIYNGGNELITHTIGDGPVIVLLSGLGNGHESYNWQLSTSEQREKTKLPLIESVQKRIANLGYKVISFDPPGYGENLSYPVPESLDEYCTLIKKMKPKLIIGHSIGGRIAQYYGEINKILYVMLDPTPDYILEKFEYTKHLEQPENIKYQNTYKFLKMIKNSKKAIKSLKWNPEVLIYSIDDNDERKNTKNEYFEKMNTNKIKLENATHWVHISNPDILVTAINKVSINEV